MGHSHAHIFPSARHCCVIGKAAGCGYKTPADASRRAGAGGGLHAPPWVGSAGGGLHAPPWVYTHHPVVLTVWLSHDAKLRFPIEEASLGLKVSL